jgi:translocation and assembly module TamB
MATGTRVERREPYQGREIREKIPQKTPRHRRWTWRLGLFLIVMAVLAWFLPAIVVNTPMLGWIVRKASGGLKCSISIQSVSLGWLSPITVKGIAIRDEQNHVMFEVEKISSDKSLLAILRNYTQLGQFRVEKPAVTLVLREGGSNVEDLLANFKSETPENKSPANVAIDLAIADGTVTIIDQSTKQSWRIDKVNADFNMPAETAQAITLKATAEIADARQPGKLAADVSIKSSPDDKSKDCGDITVQSESLPLAVAQSFVARYLPHAKLDGRLNCNVHANWGGDKAPGKTIVRADVQTDGFAFAAEMLGTDCLQMKQLSAAGQISISDARLDVEKTEIECDLGNFTITGSMNLNEQGKESRLVSLLHQQFQAEGSLDLARLAAMLPNTLHIRKEIQITSGRVQLALSSRRQAGADGQNGAVLHGQIAAGNLVATENGRQFAWPNPITLVLDAHDAAQGPVVDSLQCESDFLKIHAAGTPDNMAASLSLNLKELGDQLGKFIDLDNVQLAGDGFGNVNWKRDPQQQFTADAELQLHNLQVVLPDKQPWREENLLLYCSAKGKTDAAADTRLDTAAVNVQAGDDRLTAQLLQPVADLKQGGIWPVRVLMQGQLRNWTARAASFLPLSNWRVAGTADLDVQATASKDGVNIGQAKIHATQFALASPYINMQEPELELTAAGSWNQRQYRLQLSPAALATTSLAVQADNFIMAMPQNGPFEISGTVKYQGDLGRLSQWFVDRAKPQTWAMGGQFVGNLQFKQAANLVKIEAAADVNNLAVADSTGGKFQEPLIRLSARGDYENKTGTIRLEQAQIASSFVAAAVAGRYAQSGLEKDTDKRDSSPSSPQADFTGQINYDLDRLCGLLRPYLGPNVRIAGRGASGASWRGPLTLAAGSANAGLKWDSADVYGFQVGPGEIKPMLADGVLRIEPAELAVSQGKVYLAPKIRLAPQPMELTVPPGPLVRQVQINPRMCAFFLKFIAPVLADVTSAQGTFSIDMEGCRIPLSDPAKGEFSGRFIIHSIEIGPGPLIRELAVLMGRETPAKLRREGVVPFQMANGRIYHKDLELIFPDFTIRTYGSVGLDQTLAIMTEMPVPPKWLENNPLASSLKNQTIRIPIAGTLQKPQLDRAAMEQLSQQFIKNAAKNMLEEGLNKGLDQLFKQQK